MNGLVDSGRARGATAAQLAAARRCNGQPPVTRRPVGLVRLSEPNANTKHHHISCAFHPRRVMSSSYYSVTEFLADAQVSLAASISDAPGLFKLTTHHHTYSPARLRRNCLAKRSLTFQILGTSKAARSST